MVASPTTRVAVSALRHRGWHLFDGRNAVVGRMATQISRLLTGKHKPNYTPHIDSGDTVVVLNADQIRFTGKKWQQKLYRRHTGHPGGLRTVIAKDLHAKHPLLVLRKAVAGMIDKDQHKADRVRRLRLFKAGDEFTHAKQFIESRDPNFDGVAYLNEMRIKQKNAAQEPTLTQKECDAITDDQIEPPSDPLIRESWLADQKTRKEYMALTKSKDLKRG